MPAGTEDGVQFRADGGDLREEDGVARERVSADALIHASRHRRLIRHLCLQAGLLQERSCQND